MASALTVTPAATGTARPFGASEPDTDALGGFAALLDGNEPAIGTSSSTTRSGGGMPTDLANLVKLALGFGEPGDGAEGEEPEAGDAVAAVIAAPVTQTDLADIETELTEFVDSLAALKLALDAGEPIDPELIEKIDGLLAKLGEALGLDLDAPSTDLSEADGTAGAGLFQQLAAALLPLGQGMAEQAATQQDAAAMEAARKLGVRLEALANALSGADADLPEALQNGAAASDDLRQAIERLLKGAASAEVVPEEPELAAPVLKLSEPVLAGKPATEPDKPTATPPTPAAEAKVQPPSERTDPAAERPVRTAEPAPQAPVAPAGEQAAPTAAAGTPDTSLRVDAPAQPRVIQAGYQTSQQQLNLPQLAFEIVRQVNDGNTRFQIRLDPPELGKIDVRLDIDRSGQVTARLTVEKAETLDLMQRDQRGLERALQQAGLDSQKTNLEFSLKQNPFAGQGNQGQDGQGQGRNGFGASATEAHEEPQPTVNLYRGSLTASGVNIIA
ncbi:flagellar hook-length control protein FliK [Devosia albogilva]|uniref:Flagellar hook-length control protein FliK n=1 Tax=Devosia albogilva TaxID=429726 RepID=A0ABW5QHY1_9HYPH